MYYYFDESGNWQEPQNEKNRLVIAGLLLKDEVLKNDLKQEIDLFKSKNGLKIIHANEMNWGLKDQLYQIIYDYVKLDDIKVLVHQFNPKLLFSKTQKEPDELYIEIASSLISDMTFGDEKINIEYDMKFHYSYPQNIINNLGANRRNEYIQMEKSFVLSEEEYRKNKKRITNTISNSLEKTKNPKLQEIYNLLYQSRSDKQFKFISQYLWTEFRLKIDKSNFIKEKFKDKIEDHTKQKCKDYSIPYEGTKTKIKYQHKQYQSAGVQIIDVINNLVWKYGQYAPSKSSSAIKGIYDNICIKDITNEI